MTQVIESKHGMPTGSYQVTYYRLRDGVAVRQAGDDSGVSEQYVRHAARELRRGEALVARCQSQPGGCEAYGGEAIRDAMEAEGK